MGLEALWALVALAADTGQGRARQSHSPATTASVPPPPISSRLHRQERHGALNALGLLPASVALRAIPNAAAAHHRVGVQAMVRGGASILKGPWFVAKWIWSSQTHGCSRAKIIIIIKTTTVIKTKRWINARLVASPTYKQQKVMKYQ